MTNSGPLAASISREVELLHFVPGRVRIRFLRLKANQALAEKVQRKLRDVEGVELVEASHLTGTVLIRYNDSIQWESVLSAAIDLSLLPESISKAELFPNVASVRAPR
jgi:hypothetical protein